MAWKIKKEQLRKLWLLLFIILLLPFYPYKLPVIFDQTGDNKVSLEVRYSKEADTGETVILKGTEIVQNYLKQHKYKNISTESIVLTGKTPVQELSCFRQETLKYTDFRVYGHLQSPDQEKRLIFAVEDWYLLGAEGHSKFVLLKDSELWYQKRKSLLTFLAVIFIILLALTIYFIRQYYKKPKEPFKMSLKDFDERELELILGGMLTAGQQKERQRGHMGGRRRDSQERYHER